MANGVLSGQDIIALAATNRRMQAVFTALFAKAFHSIHLINVSDDNLDPGWAQLVSDQPWVGHIRAIRCVLDGENITPLDQKRLSKTVDDIRALGRLDSPAGSWTESVGLAFAHMPNLGALRIEDWNETPKFPLAALKHATSLRILHLVLPHASVRPVAFFSQVTFASTMFR